MRQSPRSVGLVKLPTTRILALSQAAEELLGMEPEKAVGLAKKEIDGGGLI